jgi:hypothetical protein
MSDRARQKGAEPVPRNRTRYGKRPTPVLRQCAYQVFDRARKAGRSLMEALSEMRAFEERMGMRRPRDPNCDFQRWC